MRTNLPAVASLLSDVAAFHGGRWEGTATEAQAAMLEVAGPARIGSVPLHRGSIVRNLEALAAGAAPDALGVTRLGTRWAVTALSDDHTATILAAWLAPDGVFLVHARHDACGADVLHGIGDDPDAPLLGDRVAHCPCPGSYALTDEGGVLDRLRAARAAS